MSEIVFTARLTEDDWDEAMRGWRCQVLLVPGAIVEAIYVEGDRIDSARYEVLTQHAFIRWIAPNKPQRVAAFIKLTETLSLDKETERWKRLAIILPVVATVIAASISGAATYFSRSPAVRSSAASAPMQALSSAMGAAGSSSSSLQDLLARESQTSRPPLASSPIQDVIAHENTDFTKAFRIELGRTYLSRFRENDAPLYFSIAPGSNAHDLQVWLVLISGDTGVRPMLSIYTKFRQKLASRWYEDTDGNTIKWTAPVTPGGYVVEVDPNVPGYSARFNLLVSAK